MPAPKKIWLTPKTWNDHDVNETMKETWTLMGIPELGQVEYTRSDLINTKINEAPADVPPVSRSDEPKTAASIIVEAASDVVNEWQGKNELSEVDKRIQRLADVLRMLAAKI